MDNLLNILELNALGDVVSLDILYDSMGCYDQLGTKKNDWKPYNPAKKNFNRFGLSLTSLDGGTSGVPDLDSLGEYNQREGTQYDEYSFRTLTPHWNDLDKITEPLEELKPWLCRSHIIRLDRGGFFPPHRDLDKCFRLIAFFNCTPHKLCLNLDDKKVPYQNGQLYYLNTLKEHSLFSFDDESYVLVLNVDSNRDAVNWVKSHLFAR